MQDILHQILRFFRQQEATGAPVLHELIDRSASYDEAYQNWRTSAGFADVYTAIQTRLRQWHQPLDNDGLELTVVESKTTGGFAIAFQEDYFSEETFSFFFDWLKERVLDLGYRSYMSDAKTISQSKGVVLKERHYLKPAFRLDDSGQRVVQQFGNITIDLQVTHGRPEMIRFMVHVYDDHMFTPAQKVKQLLDRMFGNEAQ